MDGYISFSQLNDFLFSPFSLYLHECYKTYKTSLYHDVPQTIGKQAHETIDTHKYKKKGWITSMLLCSPILRIYGKLDLYNEKTHVLVERKRLIKNIYEGYRMQVWAQYYCLKEMGYEVSDIFLHSLFDNTRYTLGVPKKEELQKLKNLIDEIQNYQPRFEELIDSKNKSLISIYANLCPEVEKNNA
jgi:CRISPR-associated protein Cas4